MRFSLGFGSSSKGFTGICGLSMRWNRKSGARQNRRNGVGGEPREGTRYLESVLRMKKRLAEVRSLGVEVKDIRKGLCDFPHRRGGRLVYLCWHLGEEKIGFWHEIQKGFGGRQAI